MAASKTPVELANQYFRTDVLSLFNTAKGQAEATKDIRLPDNKPAVRYNEDKKPDEPFRVSMTLPDGTKEYWAQVNSAYDPVTGFTAMAFELRDIDGNAILTNGQPHVMVDFPGNKSTKEDLDNSVAVVSGDSSHYFQVREEFMGRVARGMQARQERFHHEGIGTVTIGAHSLGANAAVGAAQDLEKFGIKGSETYYYEPVGAGQALQQYAPLLAAKRNKTTETTPEQILAAAEDIAGNSFGTRSKKNNFSHNKGGNQRNDNKMFGETSELDAGENMLTSHEALTGAKVLLAGAKPVRTPGNDLSVQAIMDGGGELTPEEQDIAQKQAKAFAEMAPKMQPTKTFNTAAAPPHDESANAVHKNFRDLESPASGQTNAPEAYSVNPLDTIVSYLKGKGFACGTGEEGDPQLDNALAQLFTEAQLTQVYRDSYKGIYNKEYKDVDLMPGPATRQAMVAKGVPENVIAAMDGLKLFNREQGDDFYMPPENSQDILKLAKESPKFFQPEPETRVAGNAAPAAAPKVGT